MTFAICLAAIKIVYSYHNSVYSFLPNNLGISDKKIIYKLITNQLFIYIHTYCVFIIFKN